MIPYGRQDISDEDIRAVTEALTSDFLTQGPKGPEFEAAVAAYCGAPHAVAANSATSALHVACLALGLGPGDAAWTVPITFVASANCARLCGAEVDFVDIDPRSYVMCADRLEEKLREAKRAGTLPKVVIPVHLAGQSADMARIGALAREYGFRVIEDASHAVGAEYQGAKVGGCAHSDIAVFSFHPVKIVTSAEGGMALARDAELVARMARLRSHGTTRDPDLMTRAPDGPWHYQQLDLGLNYRMTELQAALGLSQMARCDAFVQRRRKIAAAYDRLLGNSGAVLPWQHPDTDSSWHLYVIRVPGPAERRRRVFEGLHARGVGANVHYIPVHTQPYYRELGFDADAFPASLDYYREAISIPCHPGMTDGDVETVAVAVAAELAAEP